MNGRSPSGGLSAAARARSATRVPEARRSWSSINCAKQDGPTASSRPRAWAIAFVTLLSGELIEAVHEEADRLSPEVLIGDTPGWAYDFHTREGRAAFARFLQTDAASAIWLRRHVRTGRRPPFLGHLVFRVEGGLVERRLRWPLGDRLRWEADIECSGPECRDASDILDLVREDIPRLNEARAEVIGHTRRGG